MARKDIIHEAIISALEKNDWVITHDPLNINIVETYIEVDLGAEKLIIAEKATKKIAIEIKTFSSSIINDFHTAFGQYIDYRDIFNDYQIERDLYLAISERAYKQLQKIGFIQRQLVRYQIKLIVVDLEDEIIIQWIN